MGRHVICGLEELGPGEIRPAKVAGRSIAVACLTDGTYRAIADTCPHEAASLSAGRIERMWVSERVGEHRSGERHVLVCPWHNFEFDAETGRSLCEPARLRVKTYEAILEGGEIVVYV